MDEAKPKGDVLDQLARDAAAGAQFEFNPAAWDAMEAKLDSPKRGFFWWRIGGGLGVLIIVLFFIFKPYGESTDTLNESTTEQVEGSVEQNDNTPSSTNKSNAGNPQSSDEADITKKSNDNITDTKNSNPSDSQESQTDNKTLTTTETDQTTTNGLVESNKTTATRKRVTPTVLKDGNSKASTDKQNGTATTEAEIVAEKLKETESASQVNYFELSQPNAPNDSIGVREADLYGVSFETITPEWFPPKYLFDLSLKPMTLDSGNYRTPEVDSLKPFKRWSFGVLVSFDLSATGLDGFTDPGLMLGAQAEYNISRKWSIQSGVSYSVKKYSALGSEYNTSAWPGGRSDNLVAAEARCFVIDIPINIRRYIEGKNGNRWFVNSGVSTYLMLREDYDYEYAQPNPNWAPTAQVKGENNHVFGIANVSFGYETTLNKKFRLAVEPFMKLPLTGIGQGEVKFLSFGTNLVFKLK